MTPEEKAAAKARRDAETKAWLRDNHTHQFEPLPTGKYLCEGCDLEVSGDWADGYENGVRQGYREGRGG